MDDELPLTALAKPKKSSHDDDVPLSMLAKPGASISKGRPSLASKPGAGVKPAAGAPGKPGIKVKRPASSDSSSSTSTGDSSDSSSESGGKKKAKNKKGPQRLIVKKRKATGEGQDGDAEEEADNKISKKTRTAKEQIVVDLLCRWWYAMPEWPPTDPAFYEAKLKENKLRRVSIQEWEWVPDVDDHGNAKVYELTQFRGIFRKADGDPVDIRPMGTCPSYENMMKKDIAELYTLLVKAYEEQLKDLANSKYDEKLVRDDLTRALSRIKEKARQAGEMSYVAGGAAKKA